MPADATEWTLIQSLRSALQAIAVGSTYNTNAGARVYLEDAPTSIDQSQPGPALPYLVIAEITPGRADSRDILDITIDGYTSVGQADQTERKLQLYADICTVLASWCPGSAVPGASVTRDGGALVLRAAGSAVAQVSVPIRLVFDRENS